MILWRLSEYLALDGAGGLYSAGRWHTIGQPIIYTAESAALALLEALVQFSEEGLPERFQLLRIEVPNDLSSAEWKNPLPAEEGPSVAWGDHWLSERSTLLARVPAAVAPHSFNWLINPAHPDAPKLKLVDARRWNWDPRLRG